MSPFMNYSSPLIFPHHCPFQDSTILNAFISSLKETHFPPELHMCLTLFSPNPYLTWPTTTWSTQLRHPLTSPLSPVWAPHMSLFMQKLINTLMPICQFLPLDSELLMGRERVYCVYSYTASAYQDTYMEQVLNENIHLIYSHSPCCLLIEKPRDSDL